MILDFSLLVIYVFVVFRFKKNSVAIEFKNKSSQMMLSWAIAFIGAGSILTNFDVWGDIPELMIGPIYHIIIASISLAWAYKCWDATNSRPMTYAIGGMCLLQIMMAGDFVVFKDTPTALYDNYSMFSFMLHMILITIMSKANGIVIRVSHKRPVGGAR